MPMYPGLKNLLKDERIRAIEGILRLREQLALDVPQRSIKDSLLLATWNIRDFGGTRLNPEPRITESIYYMAEIISHFDLVAIQEVNSNLGPFNELMRILGPAWNFIATDVTEGHGGNGERMAFVYDRNKVQFLNIAGEIVLPKDLLIGVGEGNDSGEQFARTPFLVKFQSGWCKFTLNTVHLYYGKDSGEKFQRRVEEIDRIAGFLAARAEREQENYILLGDMNIVNPNDETMKALKNHNFVLPSQLAIQKIPDEFLSSDPAAVAASRTADNSFASNMNRDKYYDQIAFYSKRNELELGRSAKKAGVFSLYDSVFREADWESYFKTSQKQQKWGETPEKRSKYFASKWRTWQMSDHLPLWVELNIDFSTKYLKSIGEAP